MQQARRRSAEAVLEKFKYEFDDYKAAFAEATRCIEQALTSGAKELDFSGLGLTELPAAFDQTALPPINF